MRCCYQIDLSQIFKCHCLILKTNSTFGHVSKCYQLFRSAEDQFTKQNIDEDPATFSLLNLGILRLAFIFHLIRIISQDVLSFSTKAHASIHFSSINISLLIKSSVQTSLHLIILPIISALHRREFLPFLVCQIIFPESFETLRGHITSGAFHLLAEICRTAVHLHSFVRPSTGRSLIFKKKGDFLRR